MAIDPIETEAREALAVEHEREGWTMSAYDLRTAASLDDLSTANAAAVRAIMGIAAGGSRASPHA